MDEQGKVVGGVAVTVDITERKRAEQEVRRSESMLRAILENMPSGVAVRDAETGALILSNEQTRRLLGDLVETPDQFADIGAFIPMDVNTEKRNGLLFAPCQSVKWSTRRRS